jgi:hypothetical protein
MNFSAILMNLNQEQQHMMLLAASHSLGYFIADTIDIFIDYSNARRRIYIPHHVLAIIGICTVYMDTYLPIHTIWCLELGGLVHHLKHVAEANNFRPILYYLSHLGYHVIYFSSRMLLTVTIINTLPYLYNNRNIIDIIAVTVGIVLLIQNYIWWYQNLRKFLSSFG